MKRTKIIYWTSTGIIAFMMTFSAYAYFTQPFMVESFRHLGYPAYFRIELAIAKLIGALLIVAPVALRIKEWVYSGFAIVFISAFVAHVSSGDPLTVKISPLVFLMLLIASYISMHRLRNGKIERSGHAGSDVLLRGA